MRRSTKVGTQHSPGFVLLDSARNTPQNSRIISVAGHTISVSSLSASFTTHGHGVVGSRDDQIKCETLTEEPDKCLAVGKAEAFGSSVLALPSCCARRVGKGGSWTGGPGASVMDFSF